MKSFSVFAVLSASIAALGVTGLTLEDRPPIVYNPLEKRGLDKRHYGSFVCRNQNYNNWCKTILNQPGTSTATVGCGQDQYGNDQCYATCVSGYTRSSDGSSPLCTINCSGGLSPSADGSTCVNLNTDVNNCGQPGTACAVPANGSPTCTSGNCGISCNSGYTLRNGACTSTTPTCPSGTTLGSDGKTCVNLSNDVNNCGAVGKVCTSPANGSATCSNRQCGITCSSGYQASGSTCVAVCKDGTSYSSSSNSCGRFYGCSSTQDCISKTGNSASYCIPAQNACFTPSSNGGGMPAGSTCGPSVGSIGDDNQCASGLICINYKCSSPFSSDSSNCGAPGTTCPAAGSNGIATSSCTGGSCVITCNSGYSPSTDGKSCIVTSNDPKNCGGVGTVCPTTGAGVTGAQCVSSSCQVTCGTGYTQSNDKKSCIATTNDPNNCGGLGTVCPATGTGVTGAQCVSSSCQVTCGAGYTQSNDKKSCVATSNDPKNCGGLGTVCPTTGTGVTGAQCVSSSCQVTCGTGYTQSNDKKSCVATTNDPNNCGGLGTVCPATGTGVTGAQCVSSSCQVTCGSGYSQSSDKKSCIATTNDVNNCGGLGTVCPATGTGVTGAQCVSSSCQVTCGSGYAQSADKKSCVATTNDINNCGGVGIKCPTTGTGVSGAQCVSSSCQVTCGSGYSQSSDKKSCVATNNDINNCGGVGTVCPVPANGAATCSAGKCGVTCTPGYSLSNGACTSTCKDGSYYSNGSCVRYSCSNTADCQSKLGTAATGCYGGTCFQPSSNPSGIPEGGRCGDAGSGADNSCAQNLVCFYSICYNPFKSDTQNCGSYGNVCPTGNGIASSTCSNSNCVITCSKGYNLATDGSNTCVSQASDVNNCGGAGRQCPAVGNGVATSTCQNGGCVLTCSPTYTLTTSSSGQSCVAQSSDPKNCGGLGNACPAVGNGVATSTCQNNACVLTCSSGYTLSSDGSSCSATCKDGAQPNGKGGCQRASCSTNSDCVSKTGIAGAMCTYNTCYAPSSNSAGLPVGSKCGVGSETAPPGNDNTCVTGAICLNYTCQRAYNDVNNCGAYQYSCAANAGAGYVQNSATCTNGQCTVTCTSLYTSVNGVCVLKASAAPRQKKRAQKPVTLCPAGETACPIAGSASFGSFSQAQENASSLARSAGGYECLDTSSAVESCGGCASTGEGFDCTRIKHSSGVGCSAGQCVVLSCNKGYAVSASGSKCVKVHTGAARRHKGVSSGLIH